MGMKMGMKKWWHPMSMGGGMEKGNGIYRNNKNGWMSRMKWIMVI